MNKKEYNFKDLKGVIVINTEFIPTEKRIPHVINTSSVNGSYRINICGKIIKTNEDIDVDINTSMSFILKKGTHYFSKVFNTFSQINIKINESQLKNIELYDVSIVDIKNEYYYTYTDIHMYPVIYKSIVLNSGYCYEHNLNQCDCDGTKYLLCFMGQTFSASLSRHGIEHLKKLMDDHKILDIKDYKYETNYNVLGAYIYSHDVKKIQKDNDVTKHLLYYDEGIRLSNPPCILVRFNKDKIDDINAILAEKYSTKLNNMSYCSTKVNIDSEIIYENTKQLYITTNDLIKKGEELGIFNFIQ